MNTINLQFYRAIIDTINDQPSFTLSIYLIIHLNTLFSECCEELEIKGDKSSKSSIFGQFRLKNGTQDYPIQYTRIRDDAGNITYTLAKSSVSGWKVRFPYKWKYDDYFSSLNLTMILETQK